MQGAACGEATRGGHGAHAQPPHHSPRLEAGEYFDLLQAGSGHFICVCVCFAGMIGLFIVFCFDLFLI